jgi:hypothetical protein
MAANSFSGKVTDECGAITKATASGASENVARIADRIRELRRVRAKDLIPNPRNWRRHPKAQADALRGLLSEIGHADALLVRELHDGKLMILDGDLRAQVTPYIDRYYHTGVWQDLYDNNMKLWKTALLAVPDAAKVPGVPGGRAPGLDGFFTMWDVQNEHLTLITGLNEKGEGYLINSDSPKEFQDFTKYATPAGLSQIMR